MAGIMECEKLSFTYKTRTSPSLKNIHLSIDSGDFILLTGPTGCGKSTLLKALNGLIPHEIGGELTGELRINGVDSRQSSVAELSRTVGLMFQNPDDQIFLEEVSFGGNDEDMDCLSRILSADTAYLRFNGAKINGTQRTQNTIIDSESRQGMTDIINLYNLLQSATAEERVAAFGT